MPNEPIAGQAGRSRGVARRRLGSATAVAVTVVAALVSSCAGPIVGVGPSTGGGAAERQFVSPEARAACDQPGPGEREQVVDPEQVALDRQGVTDAIDYASRKGAQSVRIYRHDCLVGRSWNDPASERSRLPSWSVTKGVVAMLVGRAVTMGAVGIDDPIGEHLDGLSAEHGAITVRHLLNQTSGLRFAWVNDLQDAGVFDSVARVLDRPFEFAPGERYVYAQTTVAVLVAVVEAALGEDFQQFAERELFAPIGIERSQWRWGRDGAGRTQGFAFLDMSPQAFARLGSLLLAEGEWRGRRLIDADFIRQGRTGSEANPSYGFLWFTNTGERIRQTGGLRDDDWLERRWTPAAPVDMFGLSGLFNQNVFVIPSLDMVIVRMGLPHELFYDPIGQISGRNPDWDHRFFQILMGGVTDAEVPGPVDWVPDPDIEVDLRYVIGLDLL